MSNRNSLISGNGCERCKRRVKILSNCSCQFLTIALWQVFFYILEFVLCLTFNMIGDLHQCNFHGNSVLWVSGCCARHYTVFVDNFNGNGKMISISVPSINSSETAFAKERACGIFLVKFASTDHHCIICKIKKVI